jgi:AcrR family transcriptional regulator
MAEVLRERNRRGEGGKLRDDILAGATQLLEQAGNEEAVTLRAVARQVGISAPSIYAHFADREAIVDAIVDGAFADFNAAIYAAIHAASGPLERLRAGCAAYLRFADERPNRYRLLFERQILINAPEGPAPAIRTESFDALVRCVQDCIDAGISASTDPQLDSKAIWVGLHGYATLHALVGGFPWPDTDVLLDRLIYGLAQITSPTDPPQAS